MKGLNAATTCKDMGSDTTSEVTSPTLRENRFCPPADSPPADSWEERIRPNFAGNYVYRLAALRFPEKVLVFDDGGTFRMAVD
jgi:hypothetical protein